MSLVCENEWDPDSAMVEAEVESDDPPSKRAMVVIDNKNGELPDIDHLAMAFPCRAIASLHRSIPAWTTIRPSLPWGIRY